MWKATEGGLLHGEIAALALLETVDKDMNVRLVRFHPVGVPDIPLRERRLELFPDDYRGVGMYDAGIDGPPAYGTMHLLPGVRERLHNNAEVAHGMNGRNAKGDGEHSDEKKPPYSRQRYEHV